MRGDDQQQDGMFSYISPNKRVPQEHPLRRIRSIVDRVLDQLSPRFNKLYARAGRPSIAPEKLLRALLLQLLYSVRSERLLMEQLDYNLLFRWFVGLSMDDAVWDASTFSKNRERMLEGDIAEAFFQGVLGEARAGQLLSDEHFTVDGTLLEAWASHKSFRPVDPVGKDNDQEPKPPAARWGASSEQCQGLCGSSPILTTNAFSDRVRLCSSVCTLTAVHEGMTRDTEGDQVLIRIVSRLAA